MKLTIYTPAYNKVKTLKRTYESLVSQTNHNFEWILINDGSTDETSELVKSFCRNAFKWRYVEKENEGLSSVMNLAAKLADGEYILRVDGDDFLKEDAVEIILKRLQNPEIQDSKIASLVFLTCLTDAKICGYHPFTSVQRMNFWDYRCKFEATGDRAEVFKTAIFRKFPMPVFEGEKFCGESFVWNQISDYYDAIYYTDVIYVREYLENSITNIGARLRIANPRGMQLCLSDHLNRPISLKSYLKYSINYYRYSLHTKYGLKKLYRDVPFTSTFIGLIPGLILFLIESKDDEFVSKMRNLIRKLSEL